MRTGRLTALLILTASISQAANSDTTPSYPELPVAKIYLDIAKMSVDAWNKKFKLPPPRKAIVLEYVFHRMPVREFEAFILEDDKVLKAGHLNLSTRKTEQYRRDMDRLDGVSGHMAMLEVRDALYVYERKFLKPDALTRALFAANPGRELETRFSCIEKKANAAEFKKNTRSKFPIRSGDTIYLYGTSYIKGYLIVRNNKIVKDEGWLTY